MRLKESHKLKRKDIENNKRIAFLLHQLFVEINDEKTLVIVEGKRDFIALRNLGYKGKVFELCGKGKGTKNLISEVSSFDKVVLMLDYDRKGESLLRSLLSRLSYGGLKVDLNVRKKVKEIASNINHIEDLNKYSQYLTESGIVEQ